MEEAIKRNAQFGRRIGARILDIKATDNVDRGRAFLRKKMQIGSPGALTRLYRKRLTKGSPTSGRISRMRSETIDSVLAPYLLDERGYKQTKGMTRINRKFARGLKSAAKMTRQNDTKATLKSILGRMRTSPSVVRIPKKYR